MLESCRIRRVHLDNQSSLNMEYQTFDIRDFICVTRTAPIGLPWPVACPFDLSFARQALDAAQSAAITGTGIYLITKLPQREIIYLGLYRPMAGDVITDRWTRHLQTITWRGARIGLGPAPKERTAEKIRRRRDKLLAVIDNQALQTTLRVAHDHDVDARFTSTGNDTSVNRTRFAAEHWSEFSSVTEDSLLDHFAFDLIRMRLPADQATADLHVKEIERRLLRSIKPVCNSQFRVEAHGGFRFRNTEEQIVPAVQQAMLDVTRHKPTHRTTLRP